MVKKKPNSQLIPAKEVDQTERSNDLGQTKKELQLGISTKTSGEVGTSRAGRRAR